MMAETPRPGLLEPSPMALATSTPPELATFLATPPPPELTPYPKPPVAAVTGVPPFPVETPVPPAHRCLTPLEMCGFDPVPCPLAGSSTTNPRMVTTHQLKGVPSFSGRDKNIRVEDWIRDMKYILEAKGLTTDDMQFHEVVRNTSGRARDVVLNLESRRPKAVTAEMAFRELLEEFGEDSLVTSPMTRFYSREQKLGETASEYAVALEALLRRIEERGRRQGYNSLFGDSRDVLLTTQFMAGLRDGRTKQRLAPMQPRTMAYKDLRKELRVIAEEQQRTDERMRQQTRIDDDLPFYSMSEAANSKPNPGPKAPKSKEPAPGQGGKLATDSDLQALVTKQIEEIQAMRLEQREAIQLVRRDQSQTNYRLAQLEEAVFAPAVQPRQYDPRQKWPRFSGCYTCGSKQHLARNCPGQQQPTGPQSPQMKTTPPQTSPPQQQQASTTQSSTLNGQNLRM